LRLGLSEFTRGDDQGISAELAWDWRENVRRGANMFLGKLRRRLQPDITWKHLARPAGSLASRRIVDGHLT
jgi:hypothetical protein